MGLHEEYEDFSSSDYNFEEEDARDHSEHQKKVKRLLEERLERKRLKKELSDEFEDLEDGFDWSEFEP